MVDGSAVAVELGVAEDFGVAVDPDEDPLPAAVPPPVELLLPEELLPEEPPEPVELSACDARPVLSSPSVNLVSLCRSALRIAASAAAGTTRLEFCGSSAVEIGRAHV